MDSKTRIFGDKTVTHNSAAECFLGSISKALSLIFSTVCVCVCVRARAHAQEHSKTVLFRMPPGVRELYFRVTRTDKFGRRKRLA